MRKVRFQAGHYYHFYNRGVNRGRIFFGEENYLFCLRRLRHYFRPELAEIVAYCLMPTHYHLLVRLQRADPGKSIMQPFGVSYTKAINRQERRAGPLFQGPFQAKHVDSLPYLLHLTRYIHLNPVKAGLVDDPADWPFSSYLEYVDRRPGTLPRPEVVLDQCGSAADYAAFGGDETVDEGLIEHLLMD